MSRSARAGLASVLLLTLASAACTATGQPPAPEPSDSADAWVAPQHPVAVVNGRFVDTRTGRAFPVRGVNYFSLAPAGGGFQDRFFSPTDFDPDRVRREFQALAAAGYTTVRIFLDLCSVGPACITTSGQTGLNGAYLDTIARTMAIAKDTGLFLLLTSNDLPDGGGYAQIAERGTSASYAGYRNTVFLTTAGSDAAAAYWDAVLIGLAARRAAFDAVLAWSIVNEQWVFSTQPPLSLTSGTVTGADGASYNMSVPEQKRQLVRAGVTGYIEKVAAVIRRHDPHGLVTMGFFAPKFPNPTSIGGDWYVDTFPLMETSLDFLDFHAYPGSDISLPQIAENFGMIGRRIKPVVMGEVGAFIDRYKSAEAAGIAVQQWIAESCRLGFVGWLYWGYLRAPEAIGDATWSLTDANGFLFNALAPATWRDPCAATLKDPNLARGRPVRVSRALGAEPGSAAVDGNPATQWVSGSDAPQWIEVRLAAPSTVGAVRLRVTQDPAGRTVHQIAVSVRGGPLRVVKVLDGVTASGDELEAMFAAVDDVTAVRITTTTSPSWVAWSEIEVLGPA